MPGLEIVLMINKYVAAFTTAVAIVKVAASEPNDVLSTDLKYAKLSFSVSMPFTKL